MLCMWQGVWERGDDCPLGNCFLEVSVLQPTVSVSNKRLAFLSPRHLASSPDVLEAQSKIQKNIWMFGFNNTWYCNNDDDSNNNYMSDYIYKMLCV